MESHDSPLSEHNRGHTNMPGKITVTELQSNDSITSVCTLPAFLSRISTCGKFPFTSHAMRYCCPWTHTVVCVRCSAGMLSVHEFGGSPTPPSHHGTSYLVPREISNNSTHSLRLWWHASENITWTSIARRTSTRTRSPLKLELL